jgi:hypothetical protein
MRSSSQVIARKMEVDQVFIGLLKADESSYLAAQPR